MISQNQRNIWCKYCEKYIQKSFYNKHLKTKKHENNLAIGVTHSEPERKCNIS